MIIGEDYVDANSDTFKRDIGNDFYFCNLQIKAILKEKHCVDVMKPRKGKTTKGKKLKSPVAMVLVGKPFKAV